MMNRQMDDSNYNTLDMYMTMTLADKILLSNICYDEYLMPTFVPLWNTICQPFLGIFYYSVFTQGNIVKNKKETDDDEQTNG